MRAAMSPLGAGTAARAAVALAPPAAWRQRRCLPHAQALPALAAAPPLAARQQQQLRQRRCLPRAQAQPQAQEASSSAGTPADAASTSSKPRTATEAALAYYTAYNEKRIDKVMELIAPNCYYEDLVYEDPFVGRGQIGAYFKKIGELVPPDIKFCVEDITDGDPKKCGVRWHVEIEDERGDAVQFPFSRGCSFYEVNDQGQIVFARDIVEPAIKPGSAALSGISVVAPLVRKLGPTANPAVLKTLPIASGAMWIFYLSYIGYVMLSTSAPGLPVWQTPPETLVEVLHESANYFYVNIGLAQLGLNPVPSIAEHPVSEALFNFVNAWSLMFWPAMLADPLGRRVPNKFPIWVGTQFLTNVFLPTYLAQRLRPDPPTAAGAAGGAAAGGAAPASATATPAAAAEPPAQLPGYAPAFGAVALAVGTVSVYWALGARPEAGDLAVRWAYFTNLVATSRVDWAFVVDAGLYSVWQAWLLGAAGAAPKYRFVPFWGMAAWLLVGPQGQGTEGEQAQQ